METASKPSGCIASGRVRDLAQSALLEIMRTIRARLVMACLALALLATACGTAGATTATTRSGDTSSTSSTPTLCQVAGQVDYLVVRRTDEFPQNHIRFSFPAMVTVSSAVSARDVAKALCALPRMPSGMFCPAALGIGYHLTFAADSRAVQAVSADAAGCQEVEGLGSTRWIALEPGFWHVLGTAMRLRVPTWSTFRGTLPNG
jgi:hypothetical protein